MTSYEHPGKRLEFIGGTAGALAPIFVFLVGVAWLGLSGAPDERGFWPILLAAIAVGLAAASDRRAYSEAVLAGMSQRLVALMIMAWILAGVLAALLNAAGLVESLAWLAGKLGLAGGGYVVTAFLICCLVSTSTGTSLGTLLVCAPLLYPAGAALDASPAMLMGALLGGATFGDNISPLSDTTIASASTQGAEIGAVVRSRMRYALPAAAIAMVLYGLWGGRADATGTAAGSVAGSGGVSGSPAGLPMLAVPVLVVTLLLARRHLLEGLMAGAVAAAALGAALGLLAPSEILWIDSAAYSAKGLVIDGVGRALGISIFTLLLMGLVAGFEASGVLDRLVGVAERRAKSARGAETWIFATVSAAVLLTTHSVVALLAVGPFTRRAGERFGLAATRRANLLDVTVCTWPFLLPYCIPTLLAASTTVAGEAVGMPRLSAFTIGVVNFHSWALLAVIVAAIATGWGRDRG